MLDDLSAASLSTGSAEPAEPTTGPDLLTQILLNLRLDGVEYERCMLAAPWAVAFPAQRSARFHFAGSGGCWLHTAARGWLRLEAGGAVLLPHGTAHVLASAPDLPTVAVDSLSRVAVADDLYLVGADRRGNGAGKGAPDVMFSGTLRFNLDPLHPLIAMMPPVMLVNGLARKDATVPALLDAMEREVALDRIGACGILARLADALAASIIRDWVECGCGSSSGWLAAVRCPRIGRVIAAIHGDPERDWSVPELAGVMGASRSTFSDSFTRTMGESPARYVAKVKMFQARRWIAQDGMRIATAADRLGYESEASFSRAFKRVIGHAPSAARSPG